MSEISKRNENKFYSETQLINSYYYKSDKETNILVAGDIHYQPNVDKDIYRLLIKFARETQPDFILLPGDLIETTKFLDKYLGKSNAGLFLTPLIAPTPGIWCRGVHDFGRGYVFITQGFRKWTADLFITNCFEKFTANDVEQLIISNPNILKTKEIDNNIKKSL